jgi:hypothetical protein
VKNDRRDAFQLARQVRPGDIVQVRVPTVEQEAGPGPGPGRRPGRFDAGQASVVEVPAAPRHRLQRRHHLGCRNDASTSVVVSPIQLLRVIVRRKRPHSGAKIQPVGRRRVALPGLRPDTGTGQLAWLEARRRAHARVEDRIKAIKQAGLGRFPSREFGINQTWLQLALTADLIAWTQTTLVAGDLARAEPKTLRYHHFRPTSISLLHCGPNHRDVVADVLGPDGLVRAQRDSTFFCTNETSAISGWAPVTPGRARR